MEDSLRDPCKTLTVVHLLSVYHDLYFVDLESLDLVQTSRRRSVDLHLLTSTAVGTDWR